MNPLCLYSDYCSCVRARGREDDLANSVPHEPGDPDETRVDDHNPIRCAGFLTSCGDFQGYFAFPRNQRGCQLEVQVHAFLRSKNHTVGSWLSSTNSLNIFFVATPSKFRSPTPVEEGSRGRKRASFKQTDPQEFFAKFDHLMIT